MTSVMLSHKFGGDSGGLRLAPRDCPKRAERVAASGALCLGETLARGLARKVHNSVADPFLALYLVLGKVGTWDEVGFQRRLLCSFRPCFNTVQWGARLVPQAAGLMVLCHNLLI
jgi:hypothetical protein